ncbi:TetR/AcrR family transcriptional regulator [Devosia sp.]|uniref:TetR/AcrR family transcriptional regulator n=1 Tax=Devosia sp. TaxID=1871048 RepID=UPI002EF76CE3
MARPKTVSDEAILDAAGRVLRRSGPAGVTFAAVGAEAGLSPATLVQRYGSKDGLMRATLLRAWDQLDVSTRVADELSPVDAEGAVAMLVALSGEYGDHEQYAEGLLVLREDMRDPVLRERGARWGEALAQALGRRLTTNEPEQRRLGRLLAGQWQGALIWWGFEREGSVGEYVQKQLTNWCEVALRR